MTCTNNTLIHFIVCFLLILTIIHLYVVTVKGTEQERRKTKKEKLYGIQNSRSEFS